MENYNIKGTDTWLTPKKAIQKLRERNCNTMIGEKTLRTLIKNGFPSISVGNRNYINVDTFNEDLISFSKKNDTPSGKTEIVASRKSRKSAPKKYTYNNGTIRAIDIN